MSMKKCGKNGWSTSYGERWYNYADLLWRCTFTPARGYVERKAHRRDIPPDERLKNNVRRSIRTVEELAICNPWEWWVTLTLDQEKMDRHDIAAYKAELARWLRNQRRQSPNLKYLFIPEQHKDGAWHMHGLVMGLEPERLRSDWANAFAKLPDYVFRTLKKERELYWWPEYLKKFGYCTMEPIRSKVACAKYCVKYMQKAIDGNAIQGGKALFIASQGLERAQEVKPENVPKDVVMTSGYLWEAGAAYWYEKWRPDIQIGKLVDYSVKTVQIP